jgi:hypothetical protein
MRTRLRKLWPFLAGILAVTGSAAGIVAEAPAAKAVINVNYVISDTYSPNRDMTQNATNGDGFVHGTTQCDLCDNDVISFFQVNGPDGHVVTCTSGHWWPFVTHSLDTTYCGDDVKWIEWQGFSAGWCMHVPNAATYAHADVSNTSDRYSCSNLDGSQWVRHNHAYVNVSESDNQGSGRFVCIQDGGSGQKLQIQVFASQYCGWTVQSLG